MRPFQIVFLVVVLGVFVGGNVFLYRRLVRDVTQRAGLRWLGALLLGLIFLSVPALRALPASTTRPGLTTAALFGWGVVIYTTLSLLVAEVALRLMRRRGAPAAAQGAASGVPQVSLGDAARAEPVDEGRRRFLSRATAAGAVVLGGGVTAFGASEALGPPEVSEVPIALKGLPKALDGFTIVQLSDIHVGPIIQGRFVDRLVETTNRLKPDLVAITGDLVDGTPAQLGAWVARLQRLASRHGTFFVSGNHDYYSGWEVWSQVLTGMGLNVLRNRFVTIGDAGGSFDLVGVDDWGSRRGRGGYDLDAALAGRDAERASVLLAHQPSGFEQVAERGVGLQLSGHTHGGQMFPGNLVGDLIWGRRNAGLSGLGDALMYTSRGCGFVGPPVRLAAPPEVVKIVLVSG